MDPDRATLVTLPTELQLAIFTLLDFASAMTLCRTSRYFRATFDPRTLPEAERRRYMRQVESYARYGGPWTVDDGVGCYHCCRILPCHAFGREQLRRGLVVWNDGDDRFCIACGVASGAYRPGSVIRHTPSSTTSNTSAFVTKFVCARCGKLQHVRPPSCRRDVICSKCWNEADDLGRTLCPCCQINRKRERAERLLALSSGNEEPPPPKEDIGRAQEGEAECEAEAAQAEEPSGWRRWLSSVHRSLRRKSLRPK